MYAGFLSACQQWRRDLLSTNTNNHHHHHTITRHRYRRKGNRGPVLHFSPLSVDPKEPPSDRQRSSPMKRPDRSTVHVGVTAVAVAMAASTFLAGCSTVAAFVPPPPSVVAATNARLQSTASLAFVPDRMAQAQSSRRRRRGPAPLFMAKDGEDDGLNEEDEDDIDLSDRDWRAFRAKLVMKEPEEETVDTSSTAEALLDIEDDLDGIGAVFATKSSSATTGDGSVGDTEGLSSESFTPLEPSQWAYDSGKVIEQGAVILGGVEQDFGFGLRQQYFHKAAILVLDHDENQFTKGIILNRPSGKFLDDDLNPGVRWRVWFGGDVQGLDAVLPDIVCLHSLKGEAAEKASVNVMKDIQWTTFENAKKLVNVGEAKPSDFWVFAGYAGWGPQQLMGELDRKSWYMVATDSQTLLKELAKQSAEADPRDAGLDTWELLMTMIGRGETAEECSGDFDDLMLKAWAREQLMSDEDGVGEGGRDGDGGVIASSRGLPKAEPIDRLMKQAAALARGGELVEGSLVRASSAERSPYLLSKQEYHKSVLLVITDDENLSVAVMLNHPAAKGLEMDIIDKSTSERKVVTVPLRYGGEYAVKGQNPLLWLHCSSKLRAAQLGSEFGPKTKEGIWKCTQEDATRAIGSGLASPDDFMVVSGVSVWTKGEGGLARGMQGEVLKGNFEVIPKSRAESVWTTLQKQEVLTNLTFVKNLATGNEAWSAGVGDQAFGENKDKEDPSIVDGIGEGYDEEDDTYVYKSDKKISDLSDDALRSWVATFLLGAPSLGS